MIPPHVLWLRGFFFKEQRQRYAATLGINLGHPHFHDVARAHNLVRIIHVAGTHLRDVHQSILVYSDIHEGAKGSHI